MIAVIAAVIDFDSCDESEWSLCHTPGTIEGLPRSLTVFGHFGDGLLTIDNRVNRVLISLPVLEAVILTLLVSPA